MSSSFVLGGDGGRDGGATSRQSAGPLGRARLSLLGLSVGDAFGERLRTAPGSVERRELPPGPWRFTDDTEMALSVVSCLDENGRIEPHRLARGFAERFDEDRGYGEGAIGWVRAVRGGVPWFEAARAMFAGGGSFGNGAAMRAAPIGAWFAGEPRVARDEARKAAAVTHAHPDGQAGAEAVAVAAALLCRQQAPGGRDLLDEVVRTLDGETETRAGLRRARDLGPVAATAAAGALGSGHRAVAQETVPFALWCAAHHAGDFEAALWAAAAGGGDLDTVCAIVGGLVALSAPAVPPTWVERREALPSL
jgi:ADP-ribosylglycohydrolase